MASGLYPYKLENFSGELSSENDVFARRIVNFHKLSGYNNLMKGIKTPQNVKKRSLTPTNKLSTNKKSGSNHHPLNMLTLLNFMDVLSPQL